MDVTDLTLLIASAEAGSFRKAANAIGQDVSSLSRRIARLEGELGVLLFERGQAGVRLTVAGKSTLTLARKALVDFEAIRANATANGRAEYGRLRVGTHLSTIGPRVRELLGRWRAAHREVALELVELDDRALLVGLRGHELSVGICFCPVLPPEMASQLLWTEQLSVALPLLHPLASADRIGWHELRQEPLLVRSWSGSNAYHELQVRLLGSGADFRPQMAGLFNVLNLVAIGEGVTFVLDYHREMAVDGVVIRPIDESDAELPVMLAWHEDTEDPVAGSFVAFIRDQAKSVMLERSAAPWQTRGPSP